MVMDDFPLKDLMRRKLQTSLTILNLAICVGVTVFFVHFGGNLVAELSLPTSGKLTAGLSVILSKFTFILVLLNSLAGVLVTSFLISITISERIRDIGLMKAVGCLTDMVFAYFTIEFSLITLAGCVLGVIFGVVANFASVWLLNSVGFHIQPKPLDPWTLFLIFFLFALFSHILGIWRIIKTMRIEPVEALSRIFPLRTNYRSGWWIPSGFGFTVKIALRSLVRRRSETVQVVMCLSIILALMTLSICGGMVAKETTQRYVERAIGRDVILVSQAEIAEQYVDLLSKFFEPKQAGAINYLVEKYVIPNSLISNLGSIRGVVKTDPRLILETTIYEYPKAIADPESPTGYITIGNHRTCRVFAVGVNPDQVVNDWFILGRKLEETDSNSAIIGDSVGSKIFDDPLKQIFKMRDAEFNIVGVCVDPVNNGEVIYVPFSTLSSLTGEHWYNLLLLQIDSSNRPETLRRIEAEIEETNLIILDLNEVLNRHTKFLDYTWSMVLTLSLSSLLNAIFCLLGYMTLSLMSQRGDLGVMRALGAKPSTITKIIFLQSLLLVLVSGAIAVPLGLVVTFVFFIPEATISQASLLPIAGLILLVFAALSMSSTYPAIRITREPMNKAIPLG